ncbi:PTPA-CTERM sorting domain-containing protein [Streptomyces cyaneofuscatus]
MSRRAWPCCPALLPGLVGLGLGFSRRGTRACS